MKHIKMKGLYLKKQNAALFATRFSVQEFFHPSITTLFVDGRYLSILQCSIYFQDFLQPCTSNFITVVGFCIIYFITCISKFSETNTSLHLLRNN